MNTHIIERASRAGKGESRPGPSPFAGLVPNRANYAPLTPV